MFGAEQRAERPKSAPGCTRERAKSRKRRGSGGTKQQMGGSDAGGSTNENISVAIRVRPLSAKEEEAERRNSFGRWTFDEHRIVQETECSDAVYHFDKIFPPSESTNAIYLSVARDIVHSAVVKGYNGCVLAYGQTASGKTFTMLGEGRHLGITPLAIKDVFAHISKVPSRKFTVRASYIEIYNEVMHDLLTETHNEVKLRGGSDAVFIEGLTETPISSVRQALSLIVCGEERRKVAATDWNDHSSRSHTLFRLAIEAVSGSQITNSVLYLVDLAGSECIGQLGNEERRSECRLINRSLHALSRVILTLAQGPEEERSTQHVPFRDSKLTRILQPALGGNCRTAIVCTVTPAYCHAEETVNTIRFAMRAQHVALQPEVNVVMNQDEIIQKQEQQIRDLKKQLQNNKTGLSRQSSNSSLKGGRSNSSSAALDQDLLDDRARDCELIGQQSQEMAQQRRVRRALEDQVDQLKSQLETAQLQNAEAAISRMSPHVQQKEIEDKENEEVKMLQRKVQRLRARAAQQHKASHDSKQRMGELEEEVRKLSLRGAGSHMPSTSWQHVVPDLASVVSAVEGGNQADITDAILWLVLATGVNMELADPGGRIQGVLVCISPTRDTIRYLHLPQSGQHDQAHNAASKEEVWHSVEMTEVMGIMQGQSQGAFASAGWKRQAIERRQRSFSLLCEDYTLDLIAPSSVAFDLWMEGLERILEIELSVGEDLPGN